MMDSLDTFFSSRPGWPFNPQHIRDEWSRLGPAYDINRWVLPLPFWAKRGYDQRGDEAWGVLQQDPALQEARNPMCIYLHVPFCDRKCGFCDSYSFALGPGRAAEKQAYVDHLVSELDLWSRIGALSQRPVASVHLGGGTPTFLGDTLFSRVIYACMEGFNVGSHTEWAVESNTSELTPAMVGVLHKLGFRRLHIGVQSMEDLVRRLIGRRQPAAEVQSAMRRVLDLGWVVSVDLVCGLPGQTLDGLVDGIQALIDCGVDGVSLYELLIYPQNRKWAEHHHLLERDHLSNYFLFQAGARLLEARGFHKNLFNHWATPRDKNIYFTFPQRGEDLLAVGAIADGVFGDYHYRHPDYATYLKDSNAGSPGLLGGLRRTARETRLYPQILAIQSGMIPNGMVLQSLAEKWLEHALVEEDAYGNLRLTTSGSWFAGNMIGEIAEAVE
jgi:coproporphyrinogen III oxidase-like Fe-S oxidoreductase